MTVGDEGGPPGCVCVCVYLVVRRRHSQDVSQRVSWLSPDDVDDQLLGAEDQPGEGVSFMLADWATLELATSAGEAT